MDIMTQFENDNFHILKEGFNNGQVEKYIYKYRTLEQVDMFLTNSMLKFSLHNEFNDPYDCCANINTDNTFDEIKQYLMANGGAPFNLIELMAKKYLYDKESWRKIITDAINSEIDSTGIFCGTTTPNNNLMWAHYANDNKGVCIKFDMSKDVKFFLFPKKVTYSDDFPSYNYIKEQGKVVDQLFMKSSTWKYENEVRIIKRGFSGLRQVNKSAVIEIIFGCKVLDKQINNIKNKAKNNGYCIKFKKVVTAKDSYNLNIVDL